MATYFKLTRQVLLHGSVLCRHFFVLFFGMGCISSSHTPTQMAVQRGSFSVIPPAIHNSIVKRRREAKRYNLDVTKPKIFWFSISLFFF